MFFILPVGVDYQTQRFPIITFILMGLNTLIHIVAMVLQFKFPDQFDWWMQHLWLTPASSPWYSYFTCMFVHGGIFHLLGNMVYLFLFGCFVEDHVGRWRYLAFYLVAGVVAAFGYIAMTPQHFNAHIPMGGASGAISACMGAFVLLAHKVKIEFKYIIFFFFRFWSGEFLLPAWLVMSFWFGSDLLGAFAGMSKEGESGGTAFGAHVGGFILGMIFTLIMRPILRKEAARELLGDTGGEEDGGALCPIPPEAAILIMQNEAQYGPYTLAELWQYVQAGQVSRDALYWHEGQPEWKSLRDVF